MGGSKQSRGPAGPDLGPNSAGLGAPWMWGELWGELCVSAGDAASFVVGLAQKLRGFSCPTEWLQGLREAEQRKEKANR